MSAERFAERFTADFRAVMAAVGSVRMEVPGAVTEGGPVPGADVIARELGERRYADPDVAAVPDERGRLATAEYVAADLPVRLRRGDRVVLFGTGWTVRAAEHRGRGTGQIVKLWLATDERTRGR